jgi:hypothetical protein
MSQYHKLYTPEDSAVVFIDHQPQMTFGVASIDRASLINNVTLLAKVAKEFGVQPCSRPSKRNPLAVMFGLNFSTFFQDNPSLSEVQ